MVPQEQVGVVGAVTLLETLRAVKEGAWFESVEPAEQLAAAIATVEKLEALAEEGYANYSFHLLHAELRALLNGDAS